MALAVHIAGERIWHNFLGSENYSSKPLTLYQDVQRNAQGVPECPVGCTSLSGNPLSLLWGGNDGIYPKFEQLVAKMMLETLIIEKSFKNMWLFKFLINCRQKWEKLWETDYMEKIKKWKSSQPSLNNPESFKGHSLAISPIKKAHNNLSNEWCLRNPREKWREKTIQISCTYGLNSYP